MPGRPQRPFQRPQCALKTRTAYMRIRGRLGACNILLPARAAAKTGKRPEKSTRVTALIKTSLVGRNLKCLPNVVVEHERIDYSASACFPVRKYDLPGSSRCLVNEELRNEGMHKLRDERDSAIYLSISCTDNALYVSFYQNMEEVLFK